MVLLIYLQPLWLKLILGNREELGEGVVEKNKRRSDGMVEAHGFLVGPASVELCSSGTDSIIAGSGVGIPQSDFKSRVFPRPKKGNNSDRSLVGRFQNTHLTRKASLKA